MLKPESVTSGGVTLDKARAQRAIAAINAALKAGHHPVGTPGRTERSAIRVAADKLGVDAYGLKKLVGSPDKPGRYKTLFKLEPNWQLYEDRPFAAPRETPSPAFTSGAAIELLSRDDDTFLFGAAGDLHGGSKYTRWDVRQDLYRQFIEAGAQCSFDTGNWIDGEFRFNTYDLEVHGFDAQCQQLARQHPKGLTTYAVWGDDHEGWYVQREGIDVGRYAQAIMRDAGHDWTDLGFMESHVILRNAKSGKSTTMAVCHPGGGSSYALSYSIQKIIESLEGGEKPAVGLYGHYHKLWAGNIRNVWCVQTGCQQDQTTFMRKKRLEAHVGGALIKLRQDPRTGAIMSMSPELIRYFNRGYYAGAGRWSKHGDVKKLVRQQ
jgi:hypothetical protein